MNRINLGSGSACGFEHDLFHDIDIVHGRVSRDFQAQGLRLPYINCPVVWIPGIPLRKGLLEILGNHQNPKSLGPQTTNLPQVKTDKCN